MSRSLIPWRNKRNDVSGESRSLADFRREFDRLFDSFLRDPLAWSDRAWGGWGSWPGQWNPSLDVVDDEKMVTVRVEVPGLKPDDVNIAVVDNTLVISGEKKESDERKGDGYYHAERRFGSFRREVLLPPGVDGEKVTADYAHGVLTIQLEKSPQAMPKKIEVKVKN